MEAFVVVGWGNQVVGNLGGDQCQVPAPPQGDEAERFVVSCD